MWQVSRRVNRRGSGEDAAGIECNCLPNKKARVVRRGLMERRVPEGEQLLVGTMSAAREQV